MQKLLLKAYEKELSCITYYRNLSQRYNPPPGCEMALQTDEMNEMTGIIRTAYNLDIDSKLGTYLQVNPDLKTPLYEPNIFEIERINITRYRTGSNNLLIEIGRFATPRIPREQRICLCGMEIQTLRHVLMFCPMVQRNAEVPTFTSH